MIEPPRPPSPFWNVANGLITVMGAALAFFGTKLWAQGQKIAELTAESVAHEREDDQERKIVDQLGERQLVNIKSISETGGDNRAQNAMIAATNDRIDHLRRLRDEDVEENRRHVSEMATGRDVEKLEKEFAASQTTQAASIQTDIGRLNKEIDRLNAIIDHFRSPSPH